MSYEPPIFCDNCSSLALATLDGAPLCAECLMATIAIGDLHSGTAAISPLRIQFDNTVDNDSSSFSK